MPMIAALKIERRSRWEKYAENQETSPFSASPLRTLRSLVSEQLPSDD